MECKSPLLIDFDLWFPDTSTFEAERMVAIDGSSFPIAVLIHHEHIDLCQYWWIKCFVSQLREAHQNEELSSLMVVSLFLSYVFPRDVAVVGEENEDGILVDWTHGQYQLDADRIRWSFEGGEWASKSERRKVDANLPWLTSCWRCWVLSPLRFRSRCVGAARCGH